MIGSVHTSDYSGYVPLIRGGSEPTDRDRVTVSRQPGTEESPQTGSGRKGDSTETEKPATGDASTSAKVQLNEAELAMARELKQRDQKVRQHELAHIAASGGLAQGGPNYTYQRGPDGQNYAVGGHVRLDISPGKTPNGNPAESPDDSYRRHGLRQNLPVRIALLLLKRRRWK
jgi:hypothetical protein